LPGPLLPPFASIFSIPSIPSILTGSRVIQLPVCAVDKREQGINNVAGLLDNVSIRNVRKQPLSRLVQQRGSRNEVRVRIQAPKLNLRLALFVKGHEVGGDASRRRPRRINTVAHCLHLLKGGPRFGKARVPLRARRGARKATDVQEGAHGVKLNLK